MRYHSKRWIGGIVLFLTIVIPVYADEALAKVKGCMTCHTYEKRLIGPTWQDMARKYAGRKDAEAKLTEYTLKGTPMPNGLGWQKEGKSSLPFMPASIGLRPEEAAKLSRWTLEQK